MKIFLWTLGVIVVAGGLILGVKSMKQADVSSFPGQYDTFAQCLKDSGATFYGAFWCPHCQDQKKDFGSSDRLLPYVECSTVDEKGQTAVCKEKGIISYPTWIFKDTSQVSGKVDWKTLSEKTGCSLPANAPESALR